MNRKHTVTYRVDVDGEDEEATREPVEVIELWTKSDHGEAMKKVRKTRTLV